MPNLFNQFLKIDLLITFYESYYMNNFEPRKNSVVLNALFYMYTYDMYLFERVGRGKNRFNNK